MKANGPSVRAALDQVQQAKKIPENAGGRFRDKVEDVQAGTCLRYCGEAARDSNGQHRKFNVALRPRE